MSGLRYQTRGVRSTPEHRRPMPADFAERCMTMGYRELEAHYGAATRRIMRWLASLPAETQTARMANMNARRSVANKGNTRDAGSGDARIISGTSESAWPTMCKRGDVMMRAAMAKFYANLGERAA